MVLFQAAFQTHKINEALEATGRDELDVKAIFNHAVEAPNDQDSRKEQVRSSTTKIFSMATIMKSFMGSFKCFLDLYFVQYCALLVLSTLTDGLLCVPISVGRFSVTGKEFSAQCG